MSDLSKLESALKIKFKDQKLLTNAFIHRSYLNEHKSSHLPSNEKLEFLGDSVLSLITSVYLFKNYPDLAEGVYTDIKSSIVRTESLAEASRELNLGDYLFLSHGEEVGGGRAKENILADCFEAFLAVVFIDKGFDAAYKFVNDHLFKKRLAEIVDNRLYQSPKSRLQELTQAKFKKIPDYKVISQDGPEHARTFHVGVYFDDKQLATARGKSKKEAEEQAARKALNDMI